MTDIDSAPGALRIRSDPDAVRTAAELAAEITGGAADRDDRRVLPFTEVERLCASGLLAVTVPARLGGTDVRVPTLVEIVRLLGAADPSIGQVPHSHFVFLEAARAQGTEEQQGRFFGEVLNGRLFANAQAERTSTTVVEDRTTLTPRTGGGFRLDGEKFYATGSLFADVLVVRASRRDLAGSPRFLAFVPRDAAGVEVVDDWDGIGQRTTGSGTVRLQGVVVPSEQVLPYSALFDRPTTFGAFAQVLHAALDTGIARSALRAAATQVTLARPWFESGVERASDDPLLIDQAGELEVGVRGAEALLREAAEAVDAARTDPTDRSTAEASIATAVAKVAGARVAVAVASELFELGGARSARASALLSRYWRDARTHTLHNPVRHTVQHVGRWVLDGTFPPRHGAV